MSYSDTLMLGRSVRAWESEQFAETFKFEVASLTVDHLPLHRCLQYSSSVAEEPVRVMILSTRSTADQIKVRAGIFFTGIIAGCSCADDPTPPATYPEYAELEFTIDRNSAETTVTIAAEGD